MLADISGYIAAAPGKYFFLTIRQKMSVFAVILEMKRR